MSGAIQYVKPDSWLIYDQSQIFNELTEAKAQILALQAIPYQRRWVDELQRIQLKMEIAGTSQIEGADFSGNELDQALRAQTPEELSTRSQRQANSAIRAYKWIADLPSDIPIDEDLICKVHRLIVTDCDDDQFYARIHTAYEHIAARDPHRVVTIANDPKNPEANSIEAIELRIRAIVAARILTSS
jgi:Fic family protein